MTNVTEAPLERCWLEIARHGPWNHPIRSVNEKDATGADVGWFALLAFRHERVLKTRIGIAAQSTNDLRRLRIGERRLLFIEAIPSYSPTHEHSDFDEGGVPSMTINGPVRSVRRQ